jgi:DNA-binding MarR family transcriptional regulator
VPAGCIAGFAGVTEEERLLVSIRRIIRATDLYSKHLSKTVGLTAPQLMLLQTVHGLGAVSISRLSAEMSLSQATVTTILDRLEARGLVCRRRSEEDKRVVNALLTDKGEQVLGSAPRPLQDTFSARFQRLQDWEKSMIVAAMERVAVMMNADDIDASPLLHVGAVDRAQAEED